LELKGDKIASSKTKQFILLCSRMAPSPDRKSLESAIPLWVKDLMCLRIHRLLIAKFKKFRKALKTRKPLCRLPALNSRTTSHKLILSVTTVTPLAQWRSTSGSLQKKKLYIMQ
jgi:hypothetical protein